MRKFKVFDWVLVGLIIGSGILANADPACAATIANLANVYATAKNAITGIYGALFTVAAGVIGIIEYFMSGKNISMLFVFVVVGIAPHVLIAFIGLLFPEVETGQSVTPSTQ